LTHLSVEETVSRCIQVVEAGEATTRWRGAVPDPSLMRPAAEDWLLCMAAVRRVGASADERWLSVLDELQHRWAAAGFGVQVKWRSIQVFHVLATETGEAYRQIAFSDIGPTEIVNAWRSKILDPNPRPGRRAALQLAMNDL
jgi:hypothetical protein